MGDAHRHEVFSAWVVRHFPPKKYKTCLVVADGKGYLSAELSKHYRVRAIEAKPRQEIWRKKVTYQEGWFMKNDPVSENFIVGMHPDEATAQIILAADRVKVPFAVVPCCVKGGMETHGIRSEREWLSKLKSLTTKEVFEEKLRMNGKNIVLWGR